MNLDMARQRRLNILGQGERLSRVAIARTGDINEGRLIVHRILAHALTSECVSTTDGLDLALKEALAARGP